MGIDEAGICYWCPVCIHQWVSPFISLSLPRERLNKRPNLLVGIYLFFRQARDSPVVILWLKTKVILIPVQGKERAANSVLHHIQESIQSSFTLWPYQKETLFETPHFPRKDLKHLLGLTEGNLVHSPLLSKYSKENILETGNLQMLAHQLKCPHKSIRIRMNLGKRQLGPVEYLPLKAGKGKLKTHVFKIHLIHGKDMVHILRTHSIGCARKYYLPIFGSTNRAIRDLSCPAFSQRFFPQPRRDRRGNFLVRHRKPERVRKK